MNNNNKTPITNLWDYSKNLELSRNPQSAISWFVSKARELKGLRNYSIGRIYKDSKTKDLIKQSHLRIFDRGKMYFFLYNAKTKDKLPYWDRFPLVIPIEIYDDGFLGLNMHYLPPILRAKFLSSLVGILNNKKFDETTKFRITYELLKNTNKYRSYKPCVKRYLYSHVKTKFLNVESKEWNYAIFLPFQRFVGAGMFKIWKDSRERINNG